MRPPRFIILILICLLVTVQTGFSLEKVPKIRSDSTSNSLFEKHNVIVSIDSAKAATFGSKLEVPVRLLNANLSDVVKFNFLILFDPNFLQLSNVASPRDDFSGMNCHWEDFSYYPGNLADCGDSACPTGVVGVSGYAITDSVRNEKCLENRTDSVLFTMNFNVSNNYTYECDSSYLDLIWFDCDDNTITMKSPEDTSDGSNLHLGVDGVYKNEMLQFDVDSFPSTTGVTGQCFILTDSDILKGIDFYGGKVTMACNWIKETTGDVNLNEISNEESDYKLFYDYFLFGTSVFTVNIAAQIANTDVNYDGQTLGLDDLVYLDRIIIGDALPFNKLNSNQKAVIQIDPSTQKVYLLSDAQIKHIWLQVGGDIVPHSKSPSRKILYNYVEPYTNILITEPGSFENGNIELYDYTGEGEILEAQAATRDGAAVRLTFENIRADSAHSTE